MKCKTVFFLFCSVVSSIVTILLSLTLGSIEINFASTYLVPPTSSFSAHFLQRDEISPLSKDFISQSIVAIRRPHFAQLSSPRVVPLHRFCSVFFLQMSRAHTKSMKNLSRVRWAAAVSLVQLKLFSVFFSLIYLCSSKRRLASSHLNDSFLRAQHATKRRNVNDS